MDNADNGFAENFPVSLWGAVGLHSHSQYAATVPDMSPPNAARSPLKLLHNVPAIATVSASMPEVNLFSSPKKLFLTSDFENVCLVHDVPHIVSHVNEKAYGYSLTVVSELVKDQSFGMLLSGGVNEVKETGQAGPCNETLNADVVLSGKSRELENAACEQSSNANKRNRGRPRKCVKEMPTEELSPSFATSNIQSDSGFMELNAKIGKREDLDEQSSNLSKRKRGRPRKYAEENQTEELSPSYAPSTMGVYRSDFRFLELLKLSEFSDCMDSKLDRLDEIDKKLLTENHSSGSLKIEDLPSGSAIKSVLTKGPSAVLMDAIRKQKEIDAAVDLLFDLVMVPPSKPLAEIAKFNTDDTTAMKVWTATSKNGTDEVNVVLALATNKETEAFMSNDGQVEIQKKSSLGKTIDQFGA